jgi:two-component system response regulator AlgR
MKHNFNILILDDEILALSYLKDTIEDVIKEIPSFSSYTVQATSNQNEFWNLLENNLPQIVFLDIQMPKKSGLVIAKEIRDSAIKLGYSSEQLPLIIFTTAHENYGYQAFKVDAIDYILKPIDEEKIENILKKIIKSQEFLLKPFDETITVHSSGIDIDIPLHEVLYFKADMKYIAVVTSKKEFLINDTLLNLEIKYPNFVKTHRAYLINPNYIFRFYKKENSLFLTLKGHDIHLPVSRRQKLEIEKKIDYKIMLND